MHSQNFIQCLETSVCIALFPNMQRYDFSIKVVSIFFNYHLIIFHPHYSIHIWLSTNSSLFPVSFFFFISSKSHPSYINLHSLHNNSSISSETWSLEGLEMSMEIDTYQKESDDQYVDWKGRKANPKIHGGIRAAAFACGKLHQHRS